MFNRKIETENCQEGWYIDSDFSNVHLRLRNFYYDHYCQNSIIFWHHAKHVSLPMKDNESFHQQMREQLLKIIPETNYWRADSSVELLLEFPNDESKVDKILNIIFSNYDIQPTLRKSIITSLFNAGISSSALTFFNLPKEISQLPQKYQAWNDLIQTSNRKVDVDVLSRHQTSSDGLSQHLILEHRK